MNNVCVSILNHSESITFVDALFVRSIEDSILCIQGIIDIVDHRDCSYWF
jgi:hypothetical protein